MFKFQMSLLMVFFLVSCDSTSSSDSKNGLPAIDPEIVHANDQKLSEQDFNIHAARFGLSQKANAVTTNYSGEEFYYDTPSFRQPARQLKASGYRTTVIVNEDETNIYLFQKSNYTCSDVSPELCKSSSDMMFDLREDENLIAVPKSDFRGLLPFHIKHWGATHAFKNNHRIYSIYFSGGEDSERLFQKDRTHKWNFELDNQGKVTSLGFTYDHFRRSRMSLNEAYNVEEEYHYVGVSTFYSKFDMGLLRQKLKSITLKTCRIFHDSMTSSNTQQCIGTATKDFSYLLD